MLYEKSCILDIVFVSSAGDRFSPDPLDAAPSRCLLELSERVGEETPLADNGTGREDLLSEAQGRGGPVLAEAGGS